MFAADAVQNLLSSRLLFKLEQFEIDLYKIVIIPVVLFGYETWCLTL
jgi:hypothetical protein